MNETQVKLPVEVASIDIRGCETITDLILVLCSNCMYDFTYLEYEEIDNIDKLKRGHVLSDGMLILDDINNETVYYDFITQE